jgi:hypothetical protein
VFIDAVKLNQQVLLSDYNIFHMRRPRVAGVDMGIGAPLMMPVLKHLYQFQSLQRAQEAIIHEHIVPLRIIHPMAAGATDPAQTLDLVGFQSTMRAELMRWRQDPNYTPVVGLPIGFQYMGGQGKSLMLVNEMKQMAEFIAVGMDAPIEFVFGGAGFSGASVTMRMLENQFARNRVQLQKLMRFIVNSICADLELAPVEAQFTPLRSADDIQRKTLMLQLGQLGKVSDGTLLSEFDIDAASERPMIQQEVKERNFVERKQFLDNAENQGRASVVQARYGVDAQSEAMQRQGMTQDPQQAGAQGGQGGQAAPGDQGGQQGGSQLSQPQVGRVVKELSGMSPAERTKMIEKLKPYVDQQTYEGIVQKFAQRTAGKSTMKPLPSKLPPRRGAGSASV